MQVTPTTARAGGPSTGARTPELNAALAAAQGEFPAISKEKTAKVGNYSYNYASLDAFLSACRPILAKHGIAIVQPFEAAGDDLPVLVTELRHASGEVISSRFPLLRRPETDQQLGSTLTYLRRYTLAAMLGVAAEDDDDGQQGTAATPRAKTARKQPVVPEGHPNADPKPEPAEPVTPGHMVLTFGKYKGMTIADVAVENRQYVGWLAHEASNEKIKVAAAAFLHDDDIPF